MRLAPLLLLAATALAARTQAPVSSPTFNKDIAPIVFAHCASCHRPGEIGPFPLLTYQDVRQHATQIAAVTLRRQMPPWKPTRGSADFLDDRSLTDEQIALIQSWVNRGSVEGNPADLPPTPQWTDDWRLGRPDLVVTMRDTFTVPAAGPDVFRTFVIPIPADAPRFVEGVEFRPGNARVVHHANLGIDRTRSSRRLDDLDPAPGYAGGMVPDASYPAGYMLSWTPGQQPRPSPAGMPWRLDAGSDLVVQVHLQPTGKPEALQVSAGLYFTDEPPRRVPVGLRMGSETIEIPAGDARYVVSDTYLVPVDVDVLAAQPHAHNLARTIDAEALLPDGSKRALVSIADWDFRWQDVYRFREPIPLPRGTLLTMRFTYDNSPANVKASRPPQRVLWGPNTSNEMGDFWVQFVPKSAADLATLSADVTRKMAAEDLAAYTKLMNAEPNNPLRHDTVAMLHLQAGRIDEAIAQFRESLRLNPDSASAHYNLGTALALQRKFEEALAEFGEAVRLDPSNGDAHNNYGAMLHLRGRVAEAVEEYSRVVAIRPENAEAHDNLARGLAAAGRGLEALDQFRQASVLKPAWPAPVAGAAWLRATSADPLVKNPDQAIQLGERALVLSQRQDAVSLDALAAAYASASRFDEAVRVAQEAIEVATRSNNLALVSAITPRLALYRRAEAFTDPAAPTSASKK